MNFMVDDLLLLLLLFVRFYERRCCFNRVVSKSKSPSCRAESRSIGMQEISCDRGVCDDVFHRPSRSPSSCFFADHNDEEL